MDPKLDLIDCIHVLQREERLTLQLSGKVLGALNTRPQEYLLPYVRVCILLYNDRFMNAWAVDVEHVSQVERIIKPWVGRLFEFYPPFRREYVPFPRLVVEEIQIHYSIGSSVCLPRDIAGLLILEQIQEQNRFASDNHDHEKEATFQLVFNGLRASLGERLFNECFLDRLTMLAGRLNLWFTIESGFITEISTQTCGDVVSMSRPEEFSKSQCAHEPISDSNKVDHIPYFDLLQRCDALSSPSSGEESFQLSLTAPDLSSVTEDDIPIISVHSTTKQAKTDTKCGRRTRKRSNAARSKARSLSAKMKEDSGLFEDSSCPFEDKPDSDIFSSTVCSSSSSISNSDSVMSDTFPERLSPTFIHPQDELGDIDDCFNTDPGVVELVDGDLEVADLAQKINPSDPIQIVLLEIIKEMKTERETMREALSKLNKELSYTCLELHKALLSREQSSTSRSEETERHQERLTGAGASGETFLEEKESHQESLTGAGASNTKSFQDTEEHQRILTGAGASNTKSFQDTEEHQRILTGAGASNTKSFQEPEKHQRILTGAGASNTKSFQDAEEHQQILTGAGASNTKSFQETEEYQQILTGAGASGTKCFGAEEHQQIPAGAGASCSTETNSASNEQENTFDKEPSELMPVPPPVEFSDPSERDIPKPKRRTIFPGHADYPLSILNENYTGTISLATTHPEIGTVHSKSLVASIPQTVTAHGTSLVTPAEATHLETGTVHSESLVSPTPHTEKAHGASLVAPAKTSFPETKCKLRESLKSPLRQMGDNHNPITRSQSENPLSYFSPGLNEETQQLVASGLPSDRTSTPDVYQKLQSRWSQSARSFFQESNTRTLDWKQRLRRLGKSWKARFKPSNITRSDTCLSPPNLLRPPDH